MAAAACSTSHSGAAPQMGYAFTASQLIAIKTSFPASRRRKLAGINTSNYEYVCEYLAVCPALKVENGTLDKYIFTL